MQFSTNRGVMPLGFLTRQTFVSHQDKLRGLSKEKTPNPKRPGVWCIIIKKRVSLHSSRLCLTIVGSAFNYHPTLRRII